VRVWDVESGIERLADAGHRTPATLSLSADEHTLISTGEDGRVIHWDLRAGTGEVHPAPARVGDGRFEPSADWTRWTFRGPRWQVVSKVASQEVEVRSLDGSRLLGKAESSGVLPGFTLSPDGSYLSYSLSEGKASNPVLLWNPEREKGPRRLLGHFGLCQHLLFTHDGKRLIAGVSPNNPNHIETIWVWDVATAKVLRKLPTITGPGQMILTADDRLLITSDTGRVWDLETGTEQAQLLKEHGAISNLFLSPDERLLAGIAGAGGTDSLIVWETASWKPIRSFAASLSPHSMVFSRDGRSLFVAERDSTILEWDVSGRHGQKSAPPDRARLNALWQTLAQTPDRAYPAVWEILDHPSESVAFLKDKLAPVPPVETKRVRQLLVRLDSESFAEREEANRQLLTLGEPAAPVLRQVLKEKPSLEMKTRIEKILEEWTRGSSPERQRQLRAVAVLEWSGLPRAEDHLRRLAGGDPSASLTQASRTALRRRTEPPVGQGHLTP
jgi:hypothetical protein